MYLLSILVILTHSCFYFICADICQIDYPLINNTMDEAEMSLPPPTLITCPKPEDPPESTACCFYTVLHNSTKELPFDGDLAIPRCCHPDEQQKLFYFISDQLALIITICVTVVMVLVTTVTVVCCFWSRCPLYMVCRVKYHQDDVIAYASKEDETVNLNDMPPEEKKGVKLYSPNAVKVTTLKEQV